MKKKATAIPKKPIARKNNGVKYRKYSLKKAKSFLEKAKQSSGWCCMCQDEYSGNKTKQVFPFGWAHEHPSDEGDPPRGVCKKHAPIFVEIIRRAKKSLVNGILEGRKEYVGV